MSIFDNPPLVVDPNASPVEQVLDELCAVMRKHGYVLSFDHGAMVLGKISDGGLGSEVLVEARIMTITPVSYDWQPVVATKATKVQ